MKAVYRTEKGLVRATNQDCVIFSEELGLFGVADGMGGHRGGEIASGMTAEMLLRLIPSSHADAGEVRNTIRKINNFIYTRQCNEQELRGMGTTLTLLCARENKVILEHVGDSRAYRLRDGILRQISRDHSLIGEMIEEGRISKEEARHNPYRHVITRAVGTEPDIDVDVDEFDSEKGDIWLICSDGLYEHVSEQEIEQVLSSTDLYAAADKLISITYNNGATDNVSVVIAEVDE